MRTTSGNTEFPGVDAQRAITLNRLVQRWREALADVGSRSFPMTFAGKSWRTVTTNILLTASPRVS